MGIRRVTFIRSPTWRTGAAVSSFCGKIVDEVHSKQDFSVGVAPELGERMKRFRPVCLSGVRVNRRDGTAGAR